MLEMRVGGGGLGGGDGRERETSINDKGADHHHRGNRHTHKVTWLCSGREERWGGGGEEGGGANKGGRRGSLITPSLLSNISSSPLRSGHLDTLWMKLMTECDRVRRTLRTVHNSIRYHNYYYY